MDLRKLVRKTYRGTGLQILEIIEHSYLSSKNRSEMLNILAIQAFYWQPNRVTYDNRICTVERIRQDVQRRLVTIIVTVLLL